MQAQVDPVSVLRPLVEVVHSQSAKHRQVTQIAGLPWVIRQIEEPCVGRAHRVVSERMKCPPLSLVLFPFIPEELL